ncbi:MAG TPA: hypothetical protein VJG30_03240 [Candidatus Nanoarchaeia archaeon]|nr:hypothetical protein [Candidatus Nanoarchaeia archaeon]
MKKCQISLIVIIVLSIVILLGLSFFYIEKNIEVSGFAISSKLSKKAFAQDASQPVKSSINVIPKNIVSKVIGLKDIGVCKEFKARQIITMYKNAMQKKDPNNALNAMAKWQSGLSCLSENQAKELDKQMAVYVKGLSNKEAAAVLNPALNLIDLIESPSKNSELYKEFSRRFADPKSFNEMKQGFSNKVGLFLPDYNSIELERFTQLCVSDVTIKCSPVFDDLKNFFNKDLLGLGFCKIIETAKQAFICSRGLVCDPGELLAGDTKAKEQAYKSFGLKPADQLGATFVETAFISNKQNLLQPTSSLLDPNTLLSNGQTAGSSAEKLCEILGGKETKDKKKKSKLSKGRGKLEDFLSSIGKNADRCELSDPLKELAKRSGQGNKNLATIQCFSDPEVDEENKEFGFLVGGKNPDERCLIAEGGSQDFWSKNPAMLKPGEKMCGIGICFSRSKDGIIKVSNRESGRKEPGTSTTEGGSKTVESPHLEACNSGQCVYDNNGIKISDGTPYYFIGTDGIEYCMGCNDEEFQVILDETNNYPESCVGAGCVFDVPEEERERLRKEEEKQQEEEKKKKAEEESRMLPKSCDTDGDCGGGKCVKGKCEKAESQDEEKDKGKEENRKVEGSGRPGDDSGNPCSASEKRLLTRMKCITSTSVYGSKPAGLGSSKPLTTNKVGVTEKIIYPRPEGSDKLCLTMAVNKEISDVNAQMCKEITTRGNPGQEGRGCNFEVSVEMQRKPAKAGPDPGPGAFNKK